ncbi:MAG: helix-turn-helix transcriptional regulator [Muribaculaceae bacterium]
MLTTINHLVSLLSSTAIATTAVVLTMVHIPQKVRWEPISRARWILVFTFGILALSGFFKIDEETPKIINMVTLCVASYQALLFTHTASIMLTQSNKSRITIWAFCFITLFTILLGVTKFMIPALYPYVFLLAAAAYCGQLAVHTIVFRHHLKATAEKLEDYYDENVDYHLTPIKKFFYSALGIGILAAIAAFAPIHPWGYNVFVLVYTLYYIYVVVAIMNYCIDGEFFLMPEEDVISRAEACKNSFPTPAFAEEFAVDGGIEFDTKDPMYHALEEALKAWVARKEFVKVDVSTDQVAEQLSVTRQQLVGYFKTAHNTTFRSWRQQLRLEYALFIIRNCPSQPLTLLHEQVGFNDRSNFHSAFRKYTGITPQEYKDNLE